MSQSGSQGSEITLSDVDEGELSDSRGGKPPAISDINSNNRNNNSTDSDSEGSCLLNTDDTTDSDVPQWLRDSNQPHDSQEEESSNTIHHDSENENYSDLRRELSTLRLQHDTLQKEHSATIERAIAAEREVQLLRSDLDKTEESVFRLASEKATLTVNKDKYLAHVSSLETEAKKQTSVIEELLQQHNTDVAAISGSKTTIAVLEGKVTNLELEIQQMGTSMEEAYSIADSYRKKLSKIKNKKQGIG
eukprot:TRINITY_DN7013_c0_g1_i1.p1 TRINITY_DN7013_c0_g1~~TRINITY_DN7013_c0_g1_i1.p1  ORF type:complete len:248 (+),score=73.30 TRINITY_DN7013_c0_g1_i1:163-906(+)